MKNSTIYFLLGVGFFPVLTAFLATNPEPAASDTTKNALAETESVSGSNSGTYSWNEGENFLALQRNGIVVWQYNFDPGIGKPYFHPLSHTDGTLLTGYQPDDHPHHRALWFSWKDINGLNYWRERPETGVAEGRTSIQQVAISRHSDFSAEIINQLTYSPHDELPVLFENRTVYLSSPDENGSYVIDWVSEFNVADKEIRLERTPLAHQEGGRPHGGYGGFSFRVNLDVTHIEIHSSECTSGQEIHGNQARWLQLLARSPSGKEARAVIMTHPGNLNAPEHWWINQDETIPFYYLNPTPFFHENIVLPPNTKFQLIYRVLVPGVSLSAEEILASYHEFVKKY